MNSANWKPDFDALVYGGSAGIDTAIRGKLLDKLVCGARMKKPLLIITITGGVVRLPRFTATQ